jgi:ribosomal protein S18 acetylase RimI-like enzyme
MKDNGIRKAAREDVPALAQIVVAYHAEKGSSLDPGAVARGAAEQMRACLADSANHTIYVARSAEGEILGYVAVHWIPFPILSRVEGYVSDLLVAAAARGQSAGRALLTAVEAEARARDCVRLMLNNRHTAESYRRGFYAKAGFTERTGMANFVKEL